MYTNLDHRPLLEYPQKKSLLKLLELANPIWFIIFCKTFYQALVAEVRTFFTKIPWPLSFRKQFPGFFYVAINFLYRPQLSVPPVKELRFTGSISFVVNTKHHYNASVLKTIPLRKKITKLQCDYKLKSVAEMPPHTFRRILNFAVKLHVKFESEINPAGILIIIPECWWIPLPFCFSHYSM